MTEKDKELVEKGLSSDCWYAVWKLEEQAESEEAKKILHDRSTHLYHCEEFDAGLL
jgi:hypothetical protein